MAMPFLAPEYAVYRVLAPKLANRCKEKNAGRVFTADVLAAFIRWKYAADKDKYLAENSHQASVRFLKEFFDEVRMDLMSSLTRQSAVELATAYLAGQVALDATIRRMEILMPM